MNESMEFSNWTEYDDWLMQNYDEFAITSVEENNGKIEIKFMKKSDWDSVQKKERENAKRTKNCLLAVYKSY